MKGNKPQWEEEINKHWWIVFNGNPQQRERSKEEIIRIWKEQIHIQIKEYNKNE